MRVDVVIAVHSPSRPIGRAVASVLDGNGAHAGVTVVCHNITADEIAPGVGEQHRDRVRFLEHHDGVHSAAGPFNAGTRAARGEFVSIMGSDDTFQPGAIDAWLDLADRTEAETVIARLVIGSAHRPVPTPPTRPWLRGLADPVADRLAYRSAPLGLVSNQARERLGLEQVEGVPVGPDVPYVTRLWVETKVAVQRRGPGYAIGEDATDRVTLTPRPIAREFAFVRHLLDQDWFAAYPQPVRDAIVAKVIRIHLFGAVFYRSDPTYWTPVERRDLQAMAEHLTEAAPNVTQVLSRADRELLDGILTPSVPADELIRRAHARRRHGTPATVLTRDLRHLWRREAPPRFMAASLLTR
ncbi:glycosyltransferase [Ornithinimicrobium faecis]|uniref:Glycosyltransferase n=1 Tax=Ornithinimicrobium faecis TaxID=2934158 RepID=A0ABY4YYI4_9MICO|nr:glycosyltransferase family A protein [Ornithinimicrobium sp. HY1793]USQ81838.1 glycosyltransferase [Ornithinimicrobium sp. HY1793]